MKQYSTAARITRLVQWAVITTVEVVAVWGLVLVGWSAFHG